MNGFVQSIVYKWMDQNVNVLVIVERIVLIVVHMFYVKEYIIYIYVYNIYIVIK